MGFGSYVLRRDHITLSIDLPVFFIQVELRDNIDQLHICFPIGTKSTYVLPVTIVLIRKDPLALCVAVWNDMSVSYTHLVDPV